jgi:hypothetical protein
VTRARLAGDGVAQPVDDFLAQLARDLNAFSNSARHLKHDQIVIAGG